MTYLSQTTKKLFKKYIEIDTSRPDGKYYLQALNLLEPFLKDAGFETEMLKIPPKYADGLKNRYHLVAKKMSGKNLPTIVMYNHIDVVPADYDQAFVFREDDDRVYGRGVADQKGSTIAEIDALLKIADQDLKYNLIFLATTDEETDQLSQLDYLFDKLEKYQPFTIFDCDTFAEGVTIACMGAWQIKLKTKGKSAHSAASQLGHNAIEDLMKVVGEVLNEIKPEFTKITSDLKIHPSFNIKQVNNKFNLNIISGGSANNIIPNQAEAVFDVRFVPNCDQESLRKELQQRIEKIGQKHDIDLTLEEIVELHSDLASHSQVDELDKIYQKINGSSGQFCALGSTPMGHWCDVNQIDHFGIGVARKESNVHGENENARKQDLKNLSLVLQEFLVK